MLAGQAFAFYRILLRHNDRGFLAESAIGSYMKKVESDLKMQQLNAVKNQIFLPLSQRLYALPQEIKTDTHFAISPSQLADIEATFDEKPHGLRLL